MRHGQIVEVRWLPVLAQEIWRCCTADAPWDGHAAVPVDDAGYVALEIDGDVLEIEVGVKKLNVLWASDGLKTGVAKIRSRSLRAPKMWFWDFGAEKSAVDMPRDLGRLLTKPWVLSSESFLVLELLQELSQ